MCWRILEEDIVNFVKEFHRYGKLRKAMTTSFLSLIPKILCPQNLVNYRPICLVGNMYKVISKMLEARLQKVVGKVVYKTQTAFILGRKILDGLVVINEILDLAKRDKRECLLLKVDFTQAYDCVD